MNALNSKKSSKVKKSTKKKSASKSKEILKKITEERFQLTTEDGITLSGSYWKQGKPKAVLLWIHGYASHGRRYGHFATWMANHKILFARIDVRGHGESSGVRGFINKFKDYFLDIDAFLLWAQKNYPGLPVILGAHSHGGLIVGRYLESASMKYPVKACIMTSPFMGLGRVIPEWKKNLAKFVTNIIPKLKVPTEVEPEQISRDHSIIEMYRKDPLVFRHATVRWFTEILKTHEQVIALASNVKIPLLMMHGADDAVVSLQALNSFYHGISSKNKTIKRYKGMLHEILNEIGKEKVYKDMYNWICRLFP